MWLQKILLTLLRMPPKWFNTRSDMAFVQTVKIAKNEGGQLKPFQIKTGAITLKRYTVS